MEIAAPFIEAFHSLFSFIPTLPKPEHGLALDLRGDIERTVVAFGVLYLLDQLLCALNWFKEPKSETRYFSLHILVNAFVVYQHFPDVVATYANPTYAYLGPINTWGVSAIFALHFYHMVFYRPLALVDWIHHIVMIVVMLPLAYACAPGTMLGHGAFYASGLPGGLDYILLVMIKLGWISKMTEKQLNCWIQLWIRAPGCMIHAWLSYHNYLEARNRYYTPARLAGDPNWTARDPTSYAPLVPVDYVYLCVSVVVFTFYWNGFFFLDRVIRSHERHLVISAQQEKKKLVDGQLNAPASDADVLNSKTATNKNDSTATRKDDDIGYSKDVKSC